MSRTSLDIDDELLRKAARLTRLKTKREIVNRALEVLVKAEERKGMLPYFGSGIWRGKLKSMRKIRFGSRG